MTGAAVNPAFADYSADEHRPTIDGRPMTDRELYAAAERDPEGPAALYLARSDRPSTWRELDALDDEVEAWTEHLCLCDADDDGMGEPYAAADEGVPDAADHFACDELWSAGLAARRRPAGRCTTTTTTTTTTTASGTTTTTTTTTTPTTTETDAGER